jgi:hypothetical protein
MNQRLRFWKAYHTSIAVTAKSPKAVRLLMPLLFVQA